MSHTTDPTAVIYDALEGLQGTVHHLPPGTRQAVAEHLARVLPAVSPSAVVSADRATLLREAAGFVEAMNEGCGQTGCGACTTREDVADALRDAARRVAAEEQPAETQDEAVEPGTCGHRSSEGHPCTQPARHLGYHRNVRLDGDEWTSWVGEGPMVEETECCNALPPERFIDEAGREWLAGDCWCTLTAGHVGEHRCQPCADRVGAPGWTDQAATERPAVGEQPDTQTREADRIIAYVPTARTELHCLRCTPNPAGDIWTPVTAEELDDGGICTVCGRDVLIAKEADRG